MRRVSQETRKAGQPARSDRTDVTGFTPVTARNLGDYKCPTTA